MEDMSPKLTRQRKLFWDCQDSQFYGVFSRPPRGSQLCRERTLGQIVNWTPKFHILAKTLLEGFGRP